VGGKGMTKYFVIGDVHGKAGMLNDLLQKWDGHSQLVFLGDLIDRGENSRAVLERVKELVDQHGAKLQVNILAGCLGSDHNLHIVVFKPVN